MVGIVEQLGVAALSGLIIGVIMTAMLWVTAPKMTPRFMKGADIDGRTKRLESHMKDYADDFYNAIDDRVQAITSSLGAKVNDAVAIVDKRVESIFSNELPSLLKKELPQVVDGMMSDIMSEENMTNIKTLISSSVAEGLTPIAQTVKMAFIGNKGNEAQATNKQNLQAQKALAETAIRSHPQGAQALALGKMFDFDLPQMAAENPELAQQALGMVQSFMNKQGNGPQGGSTTQQYVKM